MLTLPDKLGIVCIHCKSRHRLTIGPIICIIGDSEWFEEEGTAVLQSCLTNHQETVHITEVCLDRDIVQCRCRICHAGFQIPVSLYETYQP